MYGVHFDGSKKKKTSPFRVSVIIFIKKLNYFSDCAKSAPPSDHD
jgi:hypothetical protein